MKTFSRNHHGFSLIEVMVAVVILAVGLMGLAKFQAELTRSAAETKTRASALALAERKLEDLRSFSEVTIPATPVVNTFYFDEIADNAGGTESGGALNLPATTYTIGGEVYTLSWTLAAIPIAGAQEINVNVAWTDLDGPQNITLAGIISATDLAAASPIGGAAAVTIDDPQISYTPGLAPEVISVDVDTGNNSKKETSKPLPDVYHGGDYNKVTFDVVTYNSLTNEVERREQFTNVNCLCSSNGTGPSITPAYTVFENGSETIHDSEGTVVTKETGVVANNQQPVECVACCRDHSDSVTGTSGAGETIAYGVTNYDASNDYAEVCRMKYVNGKLRVFQDWNLSTVTVFSDTYVSDSNMTSQTAYKNYVSAYVKDTTTTKVTLTDRDIEIDQGDSKQLQARPIYIDTVYNATASTPTYATFLAQKITDADADTLQFIPFFELNLTKLANWTDSNCTDDGGTGACVTSDAIVDEGLSENNYSRGKAMVEGTANVAAASVITARLNEGNSGVVGEADNGGVSADAADNITATVTPGGTTFSVSGNIGLCSITGPGNGPRKAALLAQVSVTGVVTYSGTSSGNCSVSPAGGNNVTLSCASLPDAGTNITVAIGTVGVIANVTLTNNVGLTAGATNVDAVICDY
jgi:prepilin-type N-terminal cleavage/methylation domain-containing protein